MGARARQLRRAEPARRPGGRPAGRGPAPGIARERVRALLGPPDAGGADEEVYFLGRSTTGPHFETYRIAYDGDGRAARLSVRRD
ncbi:hypothetical protein [Methylobacterium variabile]|uniref:hypothetical protein n=1 Tax=Methylobacterium variabile TaxID=298794 RepID=UPI000AE1CB58|nr:hypothetical protein [Methylobacterium variabile]